MPGFELTLDQVQPFSGFDLATDIRISGTYADLDNYTLDYVELPSRHDPDRLFNPRDGWRVINSLDPLWRAGIGPLVESQDTVDLIEAAIRAEMAVEHDDSMAEAAA